MKKRVLALVMSTAMIASVLTACGGGGNNAPAQDTNTANNDKSAADTTNNDAPAADTANNDKPAAPSGDEIVIWVAENAVEFTQQQAKSFQDANSNYAGYSIRVEPVGEGDAASNMITDVVGGADIYAFAQDQLTRLVTAGAISPVTGDYATWVSENNDPDAVAAGTVGEMLYAFPITSDNGYYMYYDKSVVKDPNSLDAIVADCEAAGKSVYIEINSGWYQPAFFFGAGCTLTYETDVDGNFTSCTTDYASENGVAALKAIINLHKSSAFVNGSSVSNATNFAALVGGTWDAGAAKEILGDNYACAKLPEFTVDGKNYQLGGFKGFKLLGLKPQEDAAKLEACRELAKYLSNEEVQLARYKALAWGPSNLAAIQNAEVQADEALSALRAQFEYTIPQGQYPGDYWTLATSLGDDVISGKYDSASDDELMTVLQGFQETCQSYAK